MTRSHRTLTVFGTRPEAIKLAPVILELARRQALALGRTQTQDHEDGALECCVCVTGQHREMLDQVLQWFGLEPDYDLNLMMPNQTLAGFASRALAALSDLFEQVRPDVVLVQGDTTTVMTAALAAFYHHIPVGHVEAGLRTHNRYEPFPEEINRRVATVLATYHFAPTRAAAAALLAERVPVGDIFVTGNTVIDALLMTAERFGVHGVDLDPGLELDAAGPSPDADGGSRNGTRLILVTAHRRESFGAPLTAVCYALRTLVERNPDVRIIYPVHPNPNVREPVTRLLGGLPHIHLLQPLRYEQFVYLMARAALILTDSGGIQEEAPALHKPVLVLRDTTERPEAIEAGVARLVGTDPERIVTETERLLQDEQCYRSMAAGASPFGDGHAAERIVDILAARLGGPP